MSTFFISASRANLSASINAARTKVLADDLLAFQLSTNAPVTVHECTGCYLEEGAAFFSQEATFTVTCSNEFEPLLAELAAQANQDSIMVVDNMGWGWLRGVCVDAGVSTLIGRWTKVSEGEAKVNGYFTLINGAYFIAAQN